MRTGNMKDHNENDEWVWDVFQQQDARRKAHSGARHEIKQRRHEPVHPVRLPGGCLLYRLASRKPSCTS